MKKIIISLVLMLAFSLPVSAAETEKVVKEEIVDINQISEHKETRVKSEDGKFEVTYEIEEVPAQTMMLPILITHTTSTTDEYLGYYFFKSEETTLANNTTHDMSIDDFYEVRAYCKTSGSISSGLKDYAEAELNAEFGVEIKKSRTISTVISPGERMAYAPEYKKYKVTERRTSLYPDLFPNETNIGYVWVVSGLYYYTEDI